MTTNTIPGISALQCVISSLRDTAHLSDEEGELTDQLRELRDWALSTAAQPPAGWRMVPVEPTIGMCIAGDEARITVNDSTRTPAVYRAMIATAPKAAPTPAVQQGDALIDFIENAGSVHIYRVRAGLNGPIRWDIEYGYEDATVSGRTLRDALSGVLKAGAARAAKEGEPQ